jgi:hypothetical protein
MSPCWRQRLPWAPSVHVPDACQESETEDNNRLAGTAVVRLVRLRCQDLVLVPALAQIGAFNIELSLFRVTVIARTAQKQLLPDGHRGNAQEAFQVRLTWKLVVKDSDIELERHHDIDGFPVQARSR